MLASTAGMTRVILFVVILLVAAALIRALGSLGRW